MTISKRARWRTSAACAISGVAVLAVQSGAQAQTTPQAKRTEAADVATVGEVVVTAQKRAQRIQDVPVSVTALSGEAIRAIGHQDVTALVTFVPGFEVQQFSPTTVAFNIRGVGQNDFADSQEAPIAFYNDEVYVAAMSAISGQNYDLERIEVLEGPQGTLFGRNATGGLVQYVTAKPTKTVQGYATASFGSYGEIGSEGAVSGPLSDRVRGRLSFSTDDYDGYIKNTDPKANSSSIGSRRFYAGRLQLESDVGDSGLLRLKLQYMRNDHETSAPYSWESSTANAYGLGVPSNTPDFGGYLQSNKNPFSVSEDNVPRFSRTYWSATARYEQKLGDGMQLTSITDYEQLRKSYGEDSDVSPNNLFNYYQRQRFWQASQEVRLSGKTDRLTWVGGVYGLVIVSDAHAYIDAPFINSYIVAGGPQRTTSYAVFGQGEYKITDTLNFILGGRYSDDRKKDDYKHISYNGLDPTNPSAILNPTTPPIVDDVFNPQTNSLATQRYDNWSGRIGFEYKPAPGKMLYLTANRGTKSGGFDIPNFPPLNGSGHIDETTIPYNQEVLTSYEGGFKVSVFNRRLNVNGAAFHYDYHDYQAFITQGLAYVIRNLPAEITGGELSADARLAEGLKAGMFVTYLDTLVRNVALPCGCATADRRMPQAPKWSIGWNASYRRDLGPGALTIGTDWRFDSSNYFTTFNAPIDLEPGHVVGNVQLSYTLKSWTAAINVNNVTDKRYRVYDLDNSPFLGSAQATFAHPRWIVGSITRKF